MKRMRPFNVREKKAYYSFMPRRNRQSRLRKMKFKIPFP